MVVIGLLVGGVLKGQEMILTSKMNKTMKDFTSFQAAHLQFLDTYRSRAGDFPSATTRLMGCDVAAFCQDGDQNGIIGASGEVARTDQSGNSSPQVETSMFWKHLALADMVSGVDSAADPALPRTSQTHPASPLGGAYSVYQRSNTHGISIKACPQSSVCGVGVISPRVVEAFDVKFDGDPDPSSGQIMANDGGCLYNARRYDVDSLEPCYVLYDIGR